ncbi:hypothetical protein C9374_006725 [Naegleria lovaniensis]|uniref:RING-type domain-containing protein n=1 Tax=Naegleria lovaniensis TaxID=51637 RepID=A0AA88GJB1_NAELO|nr:uncharacterized protein C9374_006725 [Naegleria lovaniensis]KAG2379608.1 hypothetical protein C9374_006725 [Naegleria lovaniensis]
MCRLLFFMIALLLFTNLVEASNQPKRGLTIQLHQAIEQRNSREVAKLLREGADFTEYVQYTFLRQNSFDVARYYHFEDEYNNIVKNWLTEVASTSKNGSHASSSFSNLSLQLVLLFIFLIVLCISICIAVGCLKILRTYWTPREVNSSSLSTQPQDATIEINNSRNLHSQSSSITPSNESLDEDHTLCCICFERKKDTALECGHVFCAYCANKCTTYCFTCRKRNSGRTIKIYY